MGRKESPVEQTISQQEEAAQLAEGRKATAEQQVILIGKDKKRIEVEISEMESKKISLQKEISETGQEFAKIQQDILDARNKLNKEIHSLSDAKKEKSDFEIGVEVVKKKLAADLAEEKNSRQLVLGELDLRKTELEKQIADIEINKNEKLLGLEKINEEIKKVSILVESLGMKMVEVQQENDKLISDKEILLGDVVKLKNQIGDKDTDLKKKEIEIETLNSSIGLKSEELDSLEKSIVTKKVEYSELEKKAFSILNKEDILKQKEAFLRSQYERAGIKWEE